MYKPINGWTKSSIIEHIKKNFKGKSICPETQRCLYRGPEGKKCAVGLFIPDDKYSKQMDDLDYVRNKSSEVNIFFGTGVNGLLTVFPNLKKHMPLERHALIQLQEIHDNSKGEEDEITLTKMLNFIEKNVE